MSTPEERATQSGWVPLEDFKGDPERWTDAEKWNERTDNLMPILKATNQKLEQKVTDSEKRVAELELTMAKIIKTTETVSQREYNRAMENIKDQQKEAINSADGETWAELEETKKKVEQSRPAPIVVGASPQDAIKDFEARNKEWYGKDEDLTDFAEVMSNRLQRQGVTDVATQLKKVEEAVKEKYPEKFGNKRREETTVDNSINPPPKKGKKFTYSTLPKEAQQACDASIDSCLRANPGMKKDDLTKQWVADYYEEELREA